MTKQDKKEIAEIKKLNAKLKRICKKNGVDILHQSVEDWRLRCSGIHTVVTHRPELTQKQLDRISELETREALAKKEDSVVKVKPLTDNMKDELVGLIEKRDAPDVLPEGAIRFIEDELDEVLYEIKSDISSKETEKGTISEPLVLALVAENYNRENGTNIPPFNQNRERTKNDWLSGEIDAEYNETVIEAKAPWSRSTFRRKVDGLEHYWQCQGYMNLKKKSKALLAYGLVDAPEHLIKDEFDRELWRQGISDRESDEAIEIETMVRERMTFAHKIHSSKRLKCFHFTLDKKDQEFMISRAILCKKLMFEMAIDWLTVNPKEKIVGEL